MQYLKKWAARSAFFGGQVLVCIGRQMYAVLPDRDVDLGIVGLDDFVVYGQQATPTGTKLNAFRVDKDDPRAPKNTTAR